MASPRVIPVGSPLSPEACLAFAVRVLGWNPDWGFEGTDEDGDPLYARLTPGNFAGRVVLRPHRAEALATLNHLLDIGVPLEPPGASPFTLAAYLVSFGSIPGGLEAARRLLQAGADPDFPDNTGVCPLEVCVNCDLDFLDDLLNAGVNVHRLDDEGMNALRSIQGMEDTNRAFSWFSRLVALGVDPDQPDIHGTTPGKILSERHADIAAFMEARAEKDHLGNAVPLPQTDAPVEKTPPRPAVRL
jgi:hypothetical protein